MAGSLEGQVDVGAGPRECVGLLGWGLEARYRGTGFRKQRVLGVGLEGFGD